MGMQPLMCRLCLFKTEELYEIENYLESSTEIKKIIDEVFNEKVTELRFVYFLSLLN